MVSQEDLDGLAPTTSSLMNSWFDSSTTPDNVTVQEFDKYVDEYLAERKVADALDEKLTEQNKKLMAMSGKLMEFLDIMGKTKHVVSQGSIQKIETSQWRPPDGEAKQVLVEKLKESGEYDNIVAFNANKFSSWYGAQREADASFSLEGVEQKVTKYIKFNKAK